MAAAGSVWYADEATRTEVSELRDRRSMTSRRSSSPTREFFGDTLVSQARLRCDEDGERDMDRLETCFNSSRSPKRGVFQEPPDHRRGPTNWSTHQLRVGGRAGFTGRNGARVGWNTMHMGQAGKTYARDKKGHNAIYSRAYPRTTPCGTHTIYAHMQESNKKGTASDCMAELEKFERETLVAARSGGAHSFRLHCVKDIEEDGNDEERDWADVDRLAELLEEDRHIAATDIQRVARGRQGRGRVVEIKKSRKEGVKFKDRDGDDDAQ